MKFEATLRVSAPFSPNQSIINKFEMRGLASVKDIGTFMLSTIPKDHQQIAEEEEVPKNELQGTSNVEGTQLPGPKFVE